MCCFIIVQQDQSNERSWDRNFAYSPSRELYRYRLYMCILYLFCSQPFFVTTILLTVVCYIFIYAYLQSAKRFQSSSLMIWHSRGLYNERLCILFLYLSVTHARCCWFILKVFYVFVCTHCLFLCSLSLCLHYLSLSYS